MIIRVNVHGHGDKERHKSLSYRNISDKLMKEVFVKCTTSDSVKECNVIYGHARLKIEIL